MIRTQGAVTRYEHSAADPLFSFMFGARVHDSYHMQNFTIFPLYFDIVHFFGQISKVYSANVMVKNRWFFNSFLFCRLSHSITFTLIITRLIILFINILFLSLTIDLLLLHFSGQSFSPHTFLTFLCLCFFVVVENLHLSIRDCVFIKYFVFIILWHPNSVSSVLIPKIYWLRQKLELVTYFRTTDNKVMRSIQFCLSDKLSADKNCPKQIVF